MPKFIGNQIDGSRDTTEAPEGETLVRLSYSQAVLLPSGEIYREIDTSDRGSRGSLAKRWYRWFALASTIESSAKATLKMLAAAREARTIRISNLCRSLAGVAAELVRREAALLAPVRRLGRNLRDAILAHSLRSSGLLEQVISAAAAEVPYNDRYATYDVALDEIERKSGVRDRSIVVMISSVGRAIKRNPSANIGSWDVATVGWRE